MSRTYLAREHALDRRVVVKVLSPELAAGVSVERFRREILMAAQMQHPHIVPVLSSGDAGGLPWFAMPYVEGESLRLRLARGALAIGEAVSILRDVARALAFAHSHGVVHRDIKPDNVLLSEGSATVTDFGIAKALSAARTGGDQVALTMTGTSIGTPAYMAPEQAAGDPRADHRSDLYAFGCMAYELLTGGAPFQGTSPARILGAHLSEKPRDVRELRGDTPPALAALVMQCLEKEPAARPQQASDLVRVLDTVTSSGAAAAAPGILAGRIRIGRAVALWAGATALVALTAWAATVVIGLPDWVLPGSLGVMLAGLPIIAFTAWVQRVAHRSYTATPTFTPGGTPSMPQGTLATLAIKASPHVSWRRTWMGGAIAVGAFAVLVVGFMVMRALGVGPAASLLSAGKLSASDQIIITDFKGPPGDSTLGITVTEALRADLAQSDVLRVLPRLATTDVLRLMQHPVDAHIDFDLARTIASREGLKAVLDGEVVTLGGRYVISTRLIAAQDGAQLAAFREEAENPNDLIPAIGRLAKQLRAKSGESLKQVRETRTLDRVTTGSLDALRKYTAANLRYDQTSDYTQAIPLFEQAVAIDSTFAMAWRRLANYYANTFRFEDATRAATAAYKYADRLSEVERQLTIATYYSLGPTVDDEKQLAALHAVLDRDSTNFIALNNASLILARRRDDEQALDYRLRAVRDRGASPLTFGNLWNAAVRLGRWDIVDTLHQPLLRRHPGNPLPVVWPGRVAAVRGEYERGEQLTRESLTKIAGNSTLLIGQTGLLANLVATRGRIRESFRLLGDARRLQSQGGQAAALLMASMDSAYLVASVLQDRARAQSMLHGALRRVPEDSLPLRERNYGAWLDVAFAVGDTALARRWHAAAREQHRRDGNAVDRPAWEAWDDATLAASFGRYEEALGHIEESDRRRLPREDLLLARRFLLLDRLQRADSAIATGERYFNVLNPARAATDARMLAGIRQRLGELYEEKGLPQEAVRHYQAFVDLWKDADPELQPRVRDVRARIARIQRQSG